MAQEAFTLYKLIILYMLDQAGMSLTNAQISDFILEMGYTNYFNIQSAITALEENKFISMETIRNSTHVHLTDEGKAVLGYCINDISDAIKKDVEVYLEKNRAEIMEETPLRRWATVEEIAQWAYFLTVTNTFCTGQSIVIDGGESIKHNFVWKE